MTLITALRTRVTLTYTRAYACRARTRGARDGARGAREVPEALCTPPSPLPLPRIRKIRDAGAYLFNASNIFNVSSSLHGRTTGSARDSLLTPPLVISVMSRG